MKEQTFRQLNKVYSGYEDKNVKTIVLHATSDSGHLSIDDKGKTKLNKDELLSLLMKGFVVVELNDAYYVPTKFSVTSSYVTVVCAGDGTAKTFYSSEQA